MRERFETIVALLAFVCWLFGLLAYVGLLPLAGTLDLELTAFFAVAAALGWVAGNIYVQRSRGLSSHHRRRLVPIYLLGPPGLLFLLRTMASTVLQAAAPLAPIYGLFVYAVLFLVPVSLRGAFRRSE